MMNNTFDFRRFIHVMWYTWSTQPLVPYIVMVASMPFLFFYLSLEARAGLVMFYSDSLFLLFSFYLMGCGWLYAGLIFGEFSKRSTAGFYVQIPASHPEKWLAKALLTFIVFPTILCLFFRGSFWLFNIISVREFAFRYLPVDWGSRDLQVTFFIFFTSLPAAFSSGLIWRRFGIFKGLAFVFGLAVLLFYVVDTSFQEFASDMEYTVLLQEVNIPWFEMDCSADTQRLVNIFWACAVYLPSLLMLVASWFLMKEKEI